MQLILGKLAGGFALCDVVLTILAPCPRRKSINRSGPGFGYGFLVAFCFTLAFFCLLVGLILDSFKDVVKNTLEGSERTQEQRTRSSRQQKKAQPAQFVHNNALPRRVQQRPLCCLA